MAGNVQFVDYQDALSIRVGKFLLAKGFDLASSSGVASDSLEETETCSLGILYKDPDAKPRTYLRGLIKIQPRRAFLGTVWFGSAHDATEDNWVFVAYGRKYIEMVRELADEMAATFNVTIVLRLVRDQPDVESYASDYDY